MMCSTSSMQFIQSFILLHLAFPLFILLYVLLFTLFPAAWLLNSTQRNFRFYTAQFRPALVHQGLGVGCKKQFVKFLNLVCSCAICFKVVLLFSPWTVSTGTICSGFNQLCARSCINHTGQTKLCQKVTIIYFTLYKRDKETNQTWSEGAMYVCVYL